MACSITISRMSFIKLLELLITITCVGLHYKSYEAAKLDHLFVIDGTFVGFLIILIGVYAGYLLNMRISQRIDIFYSIAGAAMFAASGALIIEHGENVSLDKDRRDMQLAKGALAVINALFFAVDAFLAFRNE